MHHQFAKIMSNFMTYWTAISSWPEQLITAVGPLQWAILVLPECFFLIYWGQYSLHSPPFMYSALSKCLLWWWQLLRVMDQLQEYIALWINLINCGDFVTSEMSNLQQSLSWCPQRTGSHGKKLYKQTCMKFNSKCIRSWYNAGNLAYRDCRSTMRTLL